MLRGTSNHTSIALLGHVSDNLVHSFQLSHVLLLVRTCGGKRVAKSIVREQSGNGTDDAILD